MGRETINIRTQIKMVKIIFAILEWPNFFREMWNGVFYFSWMVILLKAVNRDFSE